MEQALGPTLADRGIEELERRMRGAFFTPPTWAARAQLALDQALGPSWRSDSMVWDAACGTGNLTRSGDFANLVLSSLDASEVALCAAQPGHERALCLVHDFLAGDGCQEQLAVVPGHGLSAELSSRLAEAAAAGQRLVFLLNPPYGTAGNMAKGAAKKASIARNAVNEEMIRAGLRKPAQQLYAQFMYRAACIAEQFGFERVTIALFSKPNYMTSPSYEAFRRFWYSRFSFAGGFLFRASHFDSLSSRWGVSFVIWNRGKTRPDDMLDLQLLDLDESGSRVISLGNKRLYSSVGRRAFEWARGPAQNSQGDAIQLRSGLSVHEHGGGRSLAGQLGWFNNDANDVYHSASTVWLQSAGKSSSNHNAGWFLTADNFLRSLVLFAARKSVKGSWINDKDEFLAPGQELSAGVANRTWVQDCLVLAMIDPSNTCCAADGLSYKQQRYSLRNQLFWMSALEVLEQAELQGCLSLARSARGAGPAQPHILSLLDEGLFSPQAGAGLELLGKLLIGSLAHREEFAEGPGAGLHLGCWDAGLHQLKGLFEARLPAEWQQLRELRRSLRDRVRDGVYRVGMLES
ncbi:MAG: hypothetical protein CMP23_06265 [Rickettsiales bacterium]|nr:hypothetical protein [Rickettsiales bacterium]